MLFIYIYIYSYCIKYARTCISCIRFAYMHMCIYARKLQSQPYWWASIARVCERITNAFEDEPHACTATSTSFCQSPLQSWHTQQRHSMSEEALFEHSHKVTWPYYESGSSRIPGKLTAPSRTAVSSSGWQMLLSEQKQSWDDFPRGVTKMTLRLNRQHHLNWRHIRNQPLLFSFSSVVVTLVFLFWLWNLSIYILIKV